MRGMRGGLAEAQQPSQVDQEHDGHARGSAQRAGKVVRDIAGSRATQPFVGKWRLVAVHRTERATDTIELLAEHLAMAQTAHEQVQQDTEVQGPGDQRTVRAAQFHGGDSTIEAPQG